MFSTNYGGRHVFTASKLLADPSTPTPPAGGGIGGAQYRAFLAQNPGATPGSVLRVAARSGAPGTATTGSVLHQLAQTGAPAPAAPNVPAGGGMGGAQYRDFMAQNPEATSGSVLRAASAPLGTGTPSASAPTPGTLGGALAAANALPTSTPPAHQPTALGGALAAANGLSTQPAAPTLSSAPTPAPGSSLLSVASRYATPTPATPTPPGGGMGGAQYRQFTAENPGAQPLSLMQMLEQAINGNSDGTAPATPPSASSPPFSGGRFGPTGYRRYAPVGY